MSTRKNNYIKCPCCETEYMAAEIFLPNAFLGYPREIIKDEKGTVLNYEGNDMCLSEEFICDNCGKKFSIEANITFKTAEVKDIFDEEF